MKIIINIDIKKIDEKCKIFKLHAGKRKHFLDVFSKTGHIFMELPDLELKHLVFDKSGDFDSDSKRQIQRSIANFNYIQYGGDVPPADLALYSPNHGLGPQTGAADKQTFNAIKFLYFDAKVGDLVVVPGRNFDGDVLVGEISQSDGALIDTEQWGAIPSRKVKWLNTHRTRHSFSLALVKQLVHPRALHLLPASSHEEIFDYAYGNWAYETKSNMALDVLPKDTNANEVSPQAISALNLLIIYYGEMHDCIHQDSPKIKSFESSLADMLASRSTEYSWEAEVHSPGNIIVRIKDPLKAGFILTMLALAGQANAADVPVKSDDLTMEVTSKWNNVPEKCDMDIAEDVKSALLHMNLDVWMKNCKAQQDLVATQLDVVSSITLNISDDGDDNE